MSKQKLAGSKQKSAETEKWQQAEFLKLTNDGDSFQGKLFGLAEGKFGNLLLAEMDGKQYAISMPTMLRQLVSEAYERGILKKDSFIQILCTGRKGRMLTYELYVNKKKVVSERKVFSFKQIPLDRLVDDLPF